MEGVGGGGKASTLVDYLVEVRQAQAARQFRRAPRRQTCTDPTPTLDALRRLLGGARCREFLPARQHVEQPEVASGLAGVGHALTHLQQLGQPLHLTGAGGGEKGSKHVFK